MADSVAEAIGTWMADAAYDDAEHELIEVSRKEYNEQGGVELESFFGELLQDEG